MSKSFNVDVNNFNNMDSIYAGITPAETTPVKPKKEVESIQTPAKGDTIVNQKGKVDIHHKAIDKETKKANKKQNYTITFKIDVDVEDYLKNVEWVKYIENKTKNYSKNAYINELIRADMLKTLKLKNNATYDELITEWEKYKKANNI